MDYQLSIAEISRNLHENLFKPFVKFIIDFIILSDLISFFLLGIKLSEFILNLIILILVNQRLRILFHLIPIFIDLQENLNQKIVIYFLLMDHFDYPKLFGFVKYNPVGIQFRWNSFNN